MKHILASLALLVIGFSAPSRAADIAVDVELILAVDVSRSMDDDEQQLQRQGYIAALRHPEVITAIQSGLTGRIAIAYVEWSGPGYQYVVVPWSLIEDAESADQVAGRIVAASPFGRFGTSISSGLVFAAAMFENNGFAGTRQVIDVSGDGPNNMGPPVLAARAAVLDRGITINGLPIVLRPGRGRMSRFDIGHLDDYYRQCVVGGPGAFTVPVTSTDQFETAIRRKLVQEIAWAKPRLIPAAEPIQATGVDCQIGEKLREDWMLR